MRSKLSADSPWLCVGSDSTVANWATLIPEYALSVDTLNDLLVEFVRSKLMTSPERGYQHSYQPPSVTSFTQRLVPTLISIVLSLSKQHYSLFPKKNVLTVCIPVSRYVKAGLTSAWSECANAKKRSESIKFEEGISANIVIVVKSVEPSSIDDVSPWTSVATKIRKYVNIYAKCANVSFLVRLIEYIFDNY